MQRNTGMHPFNAEPPMQKLQDSDSESWYGNVSACFSAQDAGWITPASLLVVRTSHAEIAQRLQLDCTRIAQFCETAKASMELCPS